MFCYNYHTPIHQVRKGEGNKNSGSESKRFYSDTDPQTKFKQNRIVGVKQFTESGFLYIRQIYYWGRRVVFFCTIYTVHCKLYNVHVQFVTCARIPLYDNHLYNVHFMIL